MEEKLDERQTTRQHDERVFREGATIFSEDDLHELINTIYSTYRYKGTQSDRLIQLIDFLALESNRFSKPELAGQTEKLSVYLNNFREFLDRNFHQGEKIENGDTIYFFQQEETSFETESFLIEFQMLSMDIEKAYRNYLLAFTSTLKV